MKSVKEILSIYKRLGKKTKALVIIVFCLNILLILFLVFRQDFALTIKDSITSQTFLQYITIGLIVFNSTNIAKFATKQRSAILDVNRDQRVQDREIKDIQSDLKEIRKDLIQEKTANKIYRELLNLNQPIKNE